MADSVNNNIPFVPENTTDPAAGLNLSINTIDALLQAAVTSIQTAPPGSPAEGDRYGVDASATGDWAGESGKIARYLDSAWSFYEAKVVMDISELAWYYWGGSSWQEVGSGGGGGGTETPTIADTSASYTLSSGIRDEFKQLTGSGTIDITIPQDSTLDLPIGYTHLVRPKNGFTGTATWVKEDAGTTVEAPAGGTLIMVPGGACAATKIGADEWIIYGVTEAA